MNSISSPGVGNQSFRNIDKVPYSTKRHGLNINNCDDEPVQTPGCVQAHGVLLVLRQSDLFIIQATENLESVLGYSLEEALNQPVAEIIGITGDEQLRAALSSKNSADKNPLYLLTIRTKGEAAKLHAFVDVTFHTVDGLVMLEFEGVLKSAVVDRNYYASIRKIVAKLQTTESLSEFCNLAADEIRELSSMDRVMIYKFHEDGHGEVFAESKRADLSSWLGLNYPAEDIPKPARDVFTRIWLRPIPDMQGGLCELVPLINPHTGNATDMTHCFLRGVSRMCSEYYHNMGVQATLTMSIRRGDHLWGLISCLSYEGPKYISYEARSACEFLAQVFSLQHGAAEDKDDFSSSLNLEHIHQRLIANAAAQGKVTSIVDGVPSVLDGMDAGGAALHYEGKWHRIGKTPGETQLAELALWLSTAGLLSTPQALYATDRLSHDYPPAVVFRDVATGLLAVPLARSGNDLMLWFKPEIIQTIAWAGDPREKPYTIGPNGPRLTPRASFEAFLESVKERALPWKQIELKAASKLRLQLIEMVIEKMQERAIIKAQLARSDDELDAFKYVAAHDLKEPLRGIHQYAFQLMENSALTKDEDRLKLERMLTLTRRMDSLLESLLHFSHISKGTQPPELVDLNEIIAEAIEILHCETAFQLTFVTPSLLPLIKCNRGWSREIFVRLISNATIYSNRSARRIEIGTICVDQDHERPGCPPGARGQDIYYVSDDGIGIEEKYFTQIFRLFKRLHGQEEYGGGMGAGLTLAKKLVERQNGLIWLSSNLELGSTFYFTLPQRDAYQI